MEGRKGKWRDGKSKRGKENEEKGKENEEKGKGGLDKGIGTLELVAKTQFLSRNHIFQKLMSKEF